MSVAAGQLIVTGTAVAVAAALFRSRMIGGNVSGGEVSGTIVTVAVADRGPTVPVTVASPGSRARNSPLPASEPAVPVFDHVTGDVPRLTPLRAASTPLAWKGVDSPTIERKPPGLTTTPASGPAAIEKVTTRGWTTSRSKPSHAWLTR